MKTNQWIKDVKTVIGCEVPQLFKVLTNIAEKEDSDRGIFARKCQSKILECIEDVKMFLGEIRRNAQDFTLHDIQHCINVIDFMGQMLVDVKSLNPAEISFFIYSALLHDIGMVKLPDEDISSDELREDHGERSARFIRERTLTNNDGTPFNFGEYDYVYIEYLPSICASHMQEFSFVEKLPQSYILDGMEIDMTLCAILLRLADAMDLKRNRAPYQLYHFLVNRIASSDHWEKHMSISNCQINKNGVYRVDGICHDEFVHRCLFNHLDMIESEIEKVFKWKNEPHPKLRLRSHLVHRNIETDGYTMWHHTFSMDILKITNLFMGEQLYGDKKLALREIIQNSIDACMVRDEINKSLGSNRDYVYHPEILIILDKENNQAIIRDNGTGMNDYIIQNYFLNIGASYYSSKDFEKKHLKYAPSGYFGIGFLSAFMISDDVYVRTAHWQEDVEYEFHFIKNDKFVTKIERTKSFSGTEIRLNLNQFMEVFKNLADGEIEIISSNRYSIIHFLNQTFWNLKIEKNYNNVILCSITTNSFWEFAKERFKGQYKYNINLSEYLIDIEGIIQINNSIIFDKIECLTEISSTNPLDVIKNGELNISNNIKKSFPFIEHFYVEDNKSFHEIRDDELSLNFNLFILFPTKEYILGLNDELIYKTEIKDFKKYFKLYRWNCICIVDSNHSIYIREVVIRNYSNISDYRERVLFETISKKLGYSPFCYIRLTEMNTRPLYNLIYTDNTTILQLGIYNGDCWLKQARINLYDFEDQKINFAFFKVNHIIMKISNNIILPNSSRTHIIKSSGDILIKAIYVCMYLWVYDNIKTDKKATVSKEYLKQLILAEWNYVEDLIKPEKKPI